VFLFDEPLSNLDAALRVQMRIELSKLHDNLQATIIYVTHDQVEAMTMADKIVVLELGNVRQFGPPLELYSHPANLFVAGFIGSPKMNFLTGELAAVDAGTATVALPQSNRVLTRVDATGGSAGDPVTLGIRPEHIVIGDDNADSTIHGEVVLVEHLGEQTLLHVESNASDKLLTVRQAGISKVASGDTIALGIPAKACYLFNAGEEAFRRLDAED